MLDTVEISQYFKPPTFESPPEFTGDRLTVLRELAAEARAELEAQTGLFGRLLADTASSDANSQELAEIAALVEEKERSDESRLRPSIEKIETTLANKTEEMNNDVILILGVVLLLFCGWLSLHRDVREGLLRFARERHDKSPQALHAKSAKDKVDWGELSREHIARYPKIRARLAE